jgi:succinate dehydrogenase/fumarate reductase flavoprotein subunit
MTEAPFEAWPLVAHICFTFEGLKVDATTQVLAEQDERIRGLHAAQEVVGVFYGNIYPLGSSGLRSMTFGRLAGQDSRPRSPRSPRPDRPVANLTRVSSCWRRQASRSTGVCKSTEFAPCCWLSKDRGIV